RRRRRRTCRPRISMMMEKTMPDPCGRSDATLQKEAAWSSCLGFTLKVAPVTYGRRFFSFELNAGLPENHLDGARCRHSGRVVYDKLARLQIPSVLYWCDKNRAVVTRLREEAARLRGTPDLFGT